MIRELVKLGMGRVAVGNSGFSIMAFWTEAIVLLEEEEGIIS